MRIFGDTSIDFVGKRRTMFIVSGLIILAGIISLVIQGGPKYSIDFTGGVSVEITILPQEEGLAEINVSDIRDALKDGGYEDAEIQRYSGTNHYLIKTQQAEGEGEELIAKITEKFPKYEVEARSQEKIGPKIGRELRGKAVLAIFYSLLGIILYIWWRFQFTFGVAAVAALFHDVLITVGIFSIVGKEISLNIVAALLTIVGYSLNDTIVVFDRIREDLKIYRRESYESVINHSINETLNRTVITSLTTFIVVLSLYLFGGTVIHDFAFALMIGIVVGTYSSIFIASPIMVEYFLKREQKKGIKRGN